jgi:hypothetical protein
MPRETPKKKDSLRARQITVLFCRCNRRFLLRLTRGALRLHTKRITYVRPCAAIDVTVSAHAVVARTRTHASIERRCASFVCREPGPRRATVATVAFAAWPKPNTRVQRVRIPVPAPIRCRYVLACGPRHLDQWRGPFCFRAKSFDHWIQTWVHDRHGHCRTFRAQVQT